MSACRLYNSYLSYLVYSQLTSSKYLFKPIETQKNIVSVKIKMNIFVAKGVLYMHMYSSSFITHLYMCLSFSMNELYNLWRKRSLYLIYPEILLNNNNQFLVHLCSFTWYFSFLISNYNRFYRYESLKSGWYTHMHVYMHMWTRTSIYSHIHPPTQTCTHECLFAIDL